MWKRRSLRDGCREKRERKGYDEKELMYVTYVCQPHTKNVNGVPQTSNNKKYIFHKKSNISTVWVVLLLTSLLVDELHQVMITHSHSTGPVSVLYKIDCTLPLVEF